MADSAHTIYWRTSLSLSPACSIRGYSRAKEATGFYCPELEIAFDAGLPTNDVPSYICLTHLHNDHVACLNKLLIENKKNPLIIIPNNEKFEQLLTSMLKYIYLASKFIHPESTKGKDPQTRYPYRIVKLDVGQSYCLKETKNNSLYVEGLPSDHGVASISFGVYEMRVRCKEEFRNLKKEEYIHLKQSNIDFTESYKFPILCYMSDTNIKPMTNSGYELILAYPTIIIECTFLEPEDLPNAKKHNHIHWDQLKNIVHANPNKFILTHFSKKYSWDHIKHFFDQYFEENGQRADLVLWLHAGLVFYHV